MFRLGVFVFVLCVVFQTAQSQNATTHKPFESYEKEGFNFMYDGNTHLMLMLMESKCYIFQISMAERNNVHTDAGLRDIEMRILKQVNGAFYTKVPTVILNPSIINQCKYANKNHPADMFLVH